MSTKHAYGSAGIPTEVPLPKPTLWPAVLALGFTLATAGLVPGASGGGPGSDTSGPSSDLDVRCDDRMAFTSSV